MKFRELNGAEEREAVYSLRYRVYIEEFGRPILGVDHARRRLVEPLDEHGRIFAAYRGATLVGSCRLNRVMPDWRRSQHDLYRLTELPEGAASAAAVYSRFVVSSELRGSAVALALYRHVRRQGLREGLRYGLADVFEDLVPFYLRLGWQDRGPVLHPINGGVRLMVIDEARSAAG